ncbi:MAG TPA: ferrous iron transport protein A [Phycisphaerae bacterium]|nr:ferrous iron transport protein A [Phycisphaerae bacterium]
METTARHLADLAPGESGKIRQLKGTPEVRHRLQEMGLTRGTAVRLVRIAPWGDPLELQVRGYRLSLRRSEAASVLIEIS